MVGSGTNTVAISSNGIDWTGLGTTIFSSNGYSVCWSGMMYVAGGGSSSQYNMAYSSDGLSWDRINTSIFDSKCNSVKYNGEIFVAGGEGSVNNLGYSFDGINYTGLGTTIFVSGCNSIEWTGSIFCALGKSLSSPWFSVATSEDGIVWTGQSTSVFSDGRHICWNGRMLVGVGSVISYSIDGSSWVTGTGSTSFSISNSVIWDGEKFIIGGSNNSGMTLSYSNDGKSWTGLGNTYFQGTGKGCNGLFFNGLLYVGCGSVGSDNNSIIYSYDGTVWTGVGSSIFSVEGNELCYNGRRDNEIIFPSVIYEYGCNSTNFSLGYSTDGLSLIGVVGSKSLISSYLDVIYNSKNDIWIGVGVAGTDTMSISYDGKNWSGLGRILFYESCRAIIWDGTKFVAGGEFNLSQNVKNSLAYSYNGINWTGLGTSVMYLSRCLEYNGKIYLCGGTWSGSGTNNNSCSYSYDGTTWTGLGTTIFNNIVKIKWGLGKFVALGEAGNLSYSTDGINWTGCGTTFLTTGNDLTVSNDKFVAVGQFLVGGSSIGYSINGVEWIKLSTLSGITIDGVGDLRNIYSIKWINNRYIIESINIFSSLNAIDWNQILSGSSSIYGTGGKNVISWNGNQIGNVKIQEIIHTGTNGTFWNSESPSSFAYSIDGIRWVSLSKNLFYQNNGGGNRSCSNGKVYVAFGGNDNSYGGLVYSYDGINFKRVNGLDTSHTSFTGLQWNGSMFVSSGLQSGVSNLYSSYNGVDWMLLTPNFVYEPKYNVMIGYTVQQISTDLGSTWTTISDPTNKLTNPRVIANDGNKFILINESNRVYSSTDGSSWTLLTNLFSFMYTIYDFAYGNGKWVLIGNGTNRLVYSSNGTEWTGLGTTIFQADVNNGSIEYGNNLWVATSGNGGGYAAILYSTDASNWTAVSGVTSLFEDFIKKAVYGNGMWVAVGGYNNRIAYSTNGRSQWTGLGSLSSLFNNVMESIAYGNNVWVVSHYGSQNSLAYSINGTQWTGLGTTVGGSNSSINLKYSINKFYCLPTTSTSPFAYISSSGTIWTNISSSITANQRISVSGLSSQIFSVSNISSQILKVKRYIQKLFWSEGDSLNNYYTSVDGISWYEGGVLLGSGLIVYDFSSNGNIICVVGGTNKIFYAYHLSAITVSSFTETGSGTINLTSIKAICYGRGKYLIDGLFVVGGGASNNTIIYTSVDGITSWTGRSCTHLVTVNGLCWKNDKFIAVGYNNSQNTIISYSFSGTIWYSSNYGSTIQEAYGVSESTKLGSLVVDGNIMLDNYGINQTQQLDITSDVYQEGFTNMSLSVKSDVNIRY